jgi:hypothetical protein
VEADVHEAEGVEEGGVMEGMNVYDVDIKTWKRNRKRALQRRKREQELVTADWRGMTVNADPCVLI